MSDRWDEPSEKLRRIAEAAEPQIRPMTAREKERVVGEAARDVHFAEKHGGRYNDCKRCMRPRGEP